MIRVKFSIRLAAFCGCSELAECNISDNPYDSSSTSKPYGAVGI